MLNPAMIPNRIQLLDLAKNVKASHRLVPLISYWIYERWDKLDFLTGMTEASGGHSGPFIPLSTRSEEDVGGDKG
jgi:hypothetical protein